MHTLAPNCTLFAKVTVKQRPYSQEPVAVHVLASMQPNFNTNTAQYFVELPLQNTSLAQVQAAIDRFQTQANAAAQQVKFVSKVFAYLVQPM
jgi:hypothetical protein